jgi:hypothetical protein
MIDVYRKYGHRTDLIVMFNCRSNIAKSLKSPSPSGGGLGSRAL